VLDLEPTTDEAEIQRAYARLARVFHPDVPLDPSLDDLRPLRAAAFIKLGQARDRLREPIARREAVERLARSRGASQPAATPPAPQAGAPPPVETPGPVPMPAGSATVAPPDVPPVDPADELLCAGRDFERGHYWEVIQRLEPLLRRVDGTDGTVGARVRMLLAQAYLKNPRWRKRAEETVIELLRESPRCVPAQVLLGDIYRASGLPARARAAFQKALALQPDHEAAARSLAELQPEPVPEPTAAGGLRGIFRGR
jgi:hypothetical protein